MTEATTDRSRAIDDYDRKRRSAKAAKSPADAIADNPLIALGGGLALGALVAALLPVTRRERELVGPYADRVRDTASEAVGAAREAGTARLGELGLTKTAGNDLVRQIIEGATDALKTSARAAGSKVRGE